jgi:hypothetical protein
METQETLNSQGNPEEKEKCLCVVVAQIMHTHLSKCKNDKE